MNFVPPRPNSDTGLGCRVISSEAAGRFRRGGANTWICDGVDDEVEIQAAIAAAENYTGGRVQLVGGRFWLSQPAGTTVYTGTCDTVTDGAVTRLDVSGWDGAFSIADVNVGDIVRIYVDGGTDPETNQDDVCYTVAAKTSGPDTITLHGKLNANYTGANDVKFTHVPCAITMKQGVALVGDAHSSTRLLLADGEEVSAILVPKGANFCKLRHFDILAETTAGISYDRLRNGIVLADNANECSIEGVSPWYIEGDGMTFCQGHGVRVYGDCWMEATEGYGIVGNNCSELILDGCMPTVNEKTCILLNRTVRVSVNQCYGTQSAAGTSWLRINNGTRNSITAARVENSSGLLDGIITINAGSNNAITGCTLRTAGDSKVIWLKSLTFGNVITGNVIDQAGAGSVGVDLDSVYKNTIVGNRFSESGGDAIDTTANLAGTNTVADNDGVLWEDRSGTAYFTNASGSSLAVFYGVMRTTGDSDLSAVEICSDATHFAGINTISVVAAGSSGVILTHGFCKGMVDKNINIAVGDELTQSAVNGVLDAAIAGDTVLAIAKAAHSAAGAGDFALTMHVLEKEDRYVK